MNRLALIGAALALAWSGQALAQDIYHVGRDSGNAANVGQFVLIDPSTGIRIGGGASVSHITSSTTTAIKTGAGVLQSICINTKGASSNTATVYDNTAGSGTVLAVLDTTAQLGCLDYNVKFSTGLTIVTATGTAADLTVAWR